LLAIGVDTRGPVPPGFDLAAAVALCAGVDTIAIQSAFREVLPKQTLPRLAVPSSASHRRVTAPPAPPPATVAVIVHDVDVVEGRRIAGAELGIDVDHLFATIDRLWSKQP
jgi:hypothetical protein